MGGLAGAAGGSNAGTAAARGRLTRWFRALAAVGGVADAPVVLILPPAEVAALAAASGRADHLGRGGGDERRERRRRVLAAIASRIAAHSRDEASSRPPLPLLGGGRGVGVRAAGVGSRIPTPNPSQKWEGSAIAIDADGRRRLAGTPLFASVAERDGWAAAALAPCPVGVDVESVDEAAAAVDAVLADTTVDDLAAWHGLAGLWAAREAVLKAIGRDLTGDPGGWRFAAGVVTATGIPPHHVDLLDLGEVVAAVAYAGT